MEALKDTAKTYNVIEARLQHTTSPMSLNDFCDMPELADVKTTQVRDCLRHLVKLGKAHKTPIFVGRDRVGYLWGKGQPTVETPVKSMPALKQEEVRLRINPDKSISILTSKFKITIEVPE
jgi:hypothetical protein